MTSLRHNSNFQINVQWNSSSGPILQNPAFFDIGYSADISLPGIVLTGAVSVSRFSGRAALALQLQPITR